MSDAAGIGAVAVLSLRLEMACLSAFCTIATGIGVTDDLDKATLGCHSLEGALAGGGQRIDGGAAELTLGNLLQAQTVSAIFKLRRQDDIVGVLTREVELAAQLTINKDLIIALALLTYASRDGSTGEIGLQIGANPVVAHGAIGHALNATGKADVWIGSLHGLVSSGRNSHKHEQ